MNYFYIVAIVADYRVKIFWGNKVVLKVFLIVCIGVRERVIIEAKRLVQWHTVLLA